MKRILLCLTLLLALIPIDVFAQTSAVPSQMNFQGRLTRPDGTPVADTPAQTLIFRLYNALTGGSKLWEQNSAGVAVKSGTFAVRLNFASGFTSGNTLATAFNGNAVFLEIQVGSATPLAPRQQLTSNAYAFLASSVPDNSITTGKLAPGVLNFSNIGGTITGGQIAAGTINASNLSTTLQGTLELLSYRPAGLQGSAGVANFPTTVAVSGNYAYVLGFSGKLESFDIRTPAAPVLRSTTTISNGFPPSIAIVGNIAYVSSGSSGVLRKYDIGNPASPALLASKPAGNAPVGVAIAGNYGYLLAQNGLLIFRTSDLIEVKLFQVTSEIAAPTAMRVAGRYAYLLYADNKLRVVDVLNPNAPVVTATVDTAASPSGIALSGNYAYVTCAGANLLQSFDLSNPAVPTVSGSVATGTAPSAITIGRNRAYVTNRSSNSLQVFDLIAPTTPAIQTTLATNNAPAAVAFNGVSAFVVNADSHTLQIFGGYESLRVASNLSVDGAGVFSEGLFAPIASIPVLSGHLLAEGGLTAPFATLPVISGSTSFTDSITVSGNAAVGTLNSAGNITAPSATLPLLNGNVNISGTLSAPAAALPTLNGNVSVGGNASIGGTLGVTGNITAPSATLPQLNGNVSVSGYMAPNSLYTNSLGVGTGTPVAPLQVLVNNATAILVGSSAFGGKSLRFGTQGGFPTIQSVQNEGSSYGSLRINPDGGNVGIGVTSDVSPTYKLLVAGLIAGAGNYVNLSDARYKSNIATFPNALDAILNLRGVTYEWKKSDYPEMNFSNGKQIGFIAQEVEKILPELVTTDSKGYKSVAYSNVVPVLVEAVKTQQKKISALEAKNAELEAKLNALASALTELKEQRK